MKKLLIYSVLVVVWLANTAAGCGSKTEDPLPNNSPSLIGRWEIGVARVYVKDAQGERIVGSFRNGLAYTFYNDGTYDGCILPGSDWDNTGQSGVSGVWNCSTNKPGRWSLKITRATGKTIEDGTLTLTAATLTSPFVLEKLLILLSLIPMYFYKEVHPLKRMEQVARDGEFTFFEKNKNYEKVTYL
jgi:hypothetical protein